MKVKRSAGWIAEPITKRHLAVAGLFERMVDKVEVHFADTPVIYAPAEIPAAISGVLNRIGSTAPAHHDGKSVYLNTNIRVAASGALLVTKLVPEINVFDEGERKNLDREGLLNYGETISIHSLFPDDRYRVIAKVSGTAGVNFGAKIDPSTMLQSLPKETFEMGAGVDIEVELSKEIALESIRAHGALSSTASWEIMRAGNYLDATIPLWVGLLVPKEASEFEFEMRLTVHAHRFPFGVPLQTDWKIFRVPLPIAGPALPTEHEASEVKRNLMSA